MISERLKCNSTLTELDLAGDGKEEKKWGENDDNKNDVTEIRR